MTEDLKAMMAEAAARHKFRPRGPFEGAQQYRDALVTFLEREDWGLAHEIRVGRRQPDWTPEEATDFQTRMLARGVDHGVHDIVHAAEIPMVIDPVTYPTTEEELLRCARAGLKSMTRMRIDHPERSLLIMVSALHDGGSLVTAAVNRDDRISILKHMARKVPIYGYFVVADTFMHRIPGLGVPGHPTKRDALIAHVGTRDMRRMIVRPYTYNAGRTKVTFDPNPPEDTDKRDPAAGVNHDPYAEIFAMPTATKVQ